MSISCSLRTIASLTDLTELKMAEEVLQTTLKRFYIILSNMRAAILLVKEEDVIEFANQAFFLQKEYDRGWDKLIFVPFFVHYPAISKAKQ